MLSLSERHQVVPPGDKYFGLKAKHGDITTVISNYHSASLEPSEISDKMGPGEANGGIGCPPWPYSSVNDENSSAVTDSG